MNVVITRVYIISWMAYRFNYMRPNMGVCSGSAGFTQKPACNFGSRVVQLNYLIFRWIYVTFSLYCHNLNTGVIFSYVRQDTISVSLSNLVTKILIYAIILLIISQISCAETFVIQFQKCVLLFIVDTLESYTCTSHFCDLQNKMVQAASLWEKCYYRCK
jgi:hypothetical protein